MSSLVSDAKRSAKGWWPSLLPQLGVNVPEKGKHGPCPVCGGTDRFHYIDDHGGGEWHCRQCDAPAHGDGLDLLCRALSISVTEAAKRVTGILYGDDRSPEMNTAPARKEAGGDAVGSSGERQREQAGNAAEPPEESIKFRVASMLATTTRGTSPYLAFKGLTGFTPPLLPDGKLFLPLVDINGDFRGAQFITRMGEKRLMQGSKKKGAFIAPDPLPAVADCVIIAEGLATALTAGILHSGTVLAALDAGNLKQVAMAIRGRWPEARIIIAADNDWHQPGELDEHGKPKVNRGRIDGEKAAAAVNGWIALPPGDVKADWNDFYQLNGAEAAKAAFTASLYQMNADQLRDEFRTLGDDMVLSDEEVRSLAALNQSYTHVTIGGKHRVVSLKPCQVNGRSHVFEELSQFRNYFLHQKQIARRGLGTAWLQWPGKSYKPGGVGFYPRPEKCPEGVYNLFTGWGVKPCPGEVAPYLEHLEKVVCSGNKQAFTYLTGWLAHLVQHPDEKPSVAIVLKAIPGTGKGSTVKPIMQMMGQYGVQINGAGQIAGKFNATMANKLLVFADEVTVSNSREADKLKGIISEDTINLERKGIDPEPMPNFSRLIFASNSEQVLRASIRERRYLVLEPSAEKAQDKHYFDRLHNWINSGGAAHLMDWLLKFDLSGFDPRRAPVTAGLIREILSNLPPAESYVYQELCSDAPFRGQARLSASEEIDRFVSVCRDTGIDMALPAARRLIGRILTVIGLDRQGRSDRGGVFYDLPAREEIERWNEIRTAFAASLNSEFEQVFGETFY